MTQAIEVEHNSLKDAFQMFNEFSQNLAESYRELEGRVGVLTRELEVAQTDRLYELTEKERLADRLQSLLKALPAGVVVLDNTGLIVDCNPAAEDLLGLPLKNNTWIDIVQRAFAPKADDGHEISLTDGRRISLSTQALAGEPGQIMLLHDVTETRAAQERLGRSKRLADLGEMAASLAHQVRTPLSSALLYSSHLAKASLPDTQRQQYAGKIRKSLKQLESQVNDMLLYVKGEVTGIAKININEFLNEISNSMESQLQTHHAKLLISVLTTKESFVANRDALLGACQNLINNSLQACAINPQLTLMVQHHEFATGEILDLAIHDNGPGIDDATQEKIFEAFYTTKSRGTGLGLAVVKSVAEAHAGEVYIDSKPGKGCKIGMLIPLGTSQKGLFSGQSLTSQISNLYKTKEQS